MKIVWPDTLVNEIFGFPKELNPDQIKNLENYISFQENLEGCFPAIISMRYKEGKTIREIAEYYGVSPNAINYRLKRRLRRFQIRAERIVNNLNYDPQHVFDYICHKLEDLRKLDKIIKEQYEIHPTEYNQAVAYWKAKYPEFRVPYEPTIDYKVDIKDGYAFFDAEEETDV